MIRLIANAEEERLPLLLVKVVRSLFYLSITLCIIAVLGMVGIVSVEIALRSFFSTSTYVSDEYSGYMLVFIGMFGLAACQLNFSFSRADFVTDIFPASLVRTLDIAFDVLAILIAALMLWKFSIYEISSIRSGSRAPTIFATPLWIPRSFLVLGMAMYLISAVLTLWVHILQLRRAGRNPSTADQGSATL